MMKMIDDSDHDDNGNENWWWWQWWWWWLADGWRPPRGGERAQRDTAPKLIVIDFAAIQNWGTCLWPVANCPTRLYQWKQAQWLRLQFCPVTVGVTEWVECSRLNHLFLNNWQAIHWLQGQTLCHKAIKKMKKKKMMMMVVVMMMTMMIGDDDND